MQDQADVPLIDTEDKVVFEVHLNSFKSFHQISICLSNLMLTGIAVPYLHNGIMSADVDDATNFEGECLIFLSHSHTKDVLVWRWKGWNHKQK